MNSQFRRVTSTLSLSVPPLFADAPQDGVNEMLDSMIMRYIPAVQGVVISHTGGAFIRKTASIKADSPFLICDVMFQATVWSPRIGMRIKGRITSCFPDHVSLLIHRIFNASIPRVHLPDEWEFEYGPAENDPQYGAIASVSLQESGLDEDGGRWVRKGTTERLGGQDGYLEFTVVGLTVANEMLSLTGSLLSRPFAKTQTLENPPSPIHLAADPNLGKDPLQGKRKSNVTPSSKRKKKAKHE